MRFVAGASATRNSWIYDSKAGISRSRASSSYSPRCLSFSSPSYSPPEDDVAIGDTIVAVHDIPVEGLTAEVRD